MILESRNKLFSVRSLENNDNKNIPLKKLAFNSWNDSDSDLPLAFSPNTVANVIILLMKRGKRLEIYDFVMHRTSFIGLLRGNQKSKF